MKTDARGTTNVRPFEPGPWFHTMTRFGNLFVRPLLRSSAGRNMHELALLCFQGRLTGKRYEVPVAYHELDGEAVILTESGWKANLRGGADVEVVHDGQRTPMRAELIEDADEVARTYEALLLKDGLEEAKPMKIGLKVEGDRTPTCGEIAAAVGGKRCVIRLRPR